MARLTLQGQRRMNWPDRWVILCLCTWRKRLPHSLDALSALIAVTSCRVLPDHFFFSLALFLPLAVWSGIFSSSFIFFFPLVFLPLSLPLLHPVHRRCHSHNGSDGARKEEKIRLHHGVSVFYPRVSVGIVKSCFCGSVRDQQLLPWLEGKKFHDLSCPHPLAHLIINGGRYCVGLTDSVTLITTSDPSVRRGFIYSLSIFQVHIK